MTNPFEMWALEQDVLDVSAQSTIVSAEILSFYNGLCAGGMSEEHALDLTRCRVFAIAQREAMIKGMKDKQK